jgi:hypothetical protein
VSINSVETFDQRQTMTTPRLSYLPSPTSLSNLDQRFEDPQLTQEFYEDLESPEILVGGESQLIRFTSLETTSGTEVTAGETSTAGTSIVSPVAMSELLRDDRTNGNVSAAISAQEHSSVAPVAASRVTLRSRKKDKVTQVAEAPPSSPIRSSENEDEIAADSQLTQSAISSEEIFSSIDSIPVPVSVPLATPIVSVALPLADVTPPAPAQIAPASTSTSKASSSTTSIASSVPIEAANNQDRNADDGLLDSQPKPVSKAKTVAFKENSIVPSDRKCAARKATPRKEPVVPQQKVDPPVSEPAAPKKGRQKMSTQFKSTPPVLVASPSEEEKESGESSSSSGSSDTDSSSGSDSTSEEEEIKTPIKASVTVASTPSVVSTPAAIIDTPVLSPPTVLTQPDPSSSDSSSSGSDSDSESGSSSSESGSSDSSDSSGSESDDSSSEEEEEAQPASAAIASTRSVHFSETTNVAPTTHDSSDESDHDGQSMFQTPSKNALQVHCPPPPCPSQLTSVGVTLQASCPEVPESDLTSER